MLETFFYGLLASSSLIIGGLIGIYVPIGNRTLGIVMAFGAGVLISTTPTLSRTALASRPTWSFKIP